MSVKHYSENLDGNSFTQKQHLCSKKFNTKLSKFIESFKLIHSIEKLGSNELYKTNQVSITVGTETKNRKQSSSSLI